MENCIKLEIKLIQATNLKDVGKLFRSKVYATVAAMGVKRRTPKGEKGETNPKWDFHTTFLFSKSEIKPKKPTITRFLYRKSEIKPKKPSLLTIELYSNTKWRLRDRCIGKVEVALNELHNQRASGVYKTMSCGFGVPFGLVLFFLGWSLSNLGVLIALVWALFFQFHPGGIGLILL